jgi:NAD(P)-dependent dehydrogenase (short-subunit alcohol dehydrogenase family)
VSGTLADDSGFGFAPGDGIVVTGGGSGIGRATAWIAAAQGLAVSIWDIDEASAVAAAAAISDAGGVASASRVDVTDEAAVTAAFAVGGPVRARYLVNNAGPASSSPISYAEGLVATAGSMQLVAARWLGLELEPGASIVNVASVAGTQLGAAPDWYASGKGAIAAYTRYLAVQHAARIRANAVAPGLTDTPRMAGFIDSDIGQRIQSRVPLGRMGRPEDVAWTILFLLSPRAAYVSGVVVAVDGAWTLAQ